MNNAVGTLLAQVEGRHRGGTVTASLQAVDPLGRMFTAAEAQHYLGVPATRVRKWAQRGRLHAMGRLRCHHPLYWEADLVALSQGLSIRDEHGCRVLLTVPMTVRHGVER